MYFDNLTLAGILMTVPYALLPLLFGQEILRVREYRSSGESSVADERNGEDQQTEGCGHPEPCQ